MGGSGGGASGKVTYPDHVTTAHSDWIDDSGSDKATTSVVASINTAQATSPYSGINAYDPAAALADAVSFLVTYDEFATALDSAAVSAELSVAEVVAAISALSVLNEMDSTIAGSVSAYTSIMDADIESTVLPRFRAGMRDINAVVSSAFVIGEALIEEGRDRDVAKYQADLRTSLTQLRTTLTADMDKARVASKMSMLGMSNDLIRLKGEMLKISGQTHVEFDRISIVANQEQINKNVELDAKDALWDLETWQYAANVLAAPGGGTSIPTAAKGNEFKSALGGAMSGAAAGSAFGPWGTVGGAVVGGLAGYLMK